MNRSWRGRIRTFVVALAALMASIAVASAQDNPPRVLARVEADDVPETYPLGVLALLPDGDGVPYLLAIATEAELEAAGRPYRVLDTPALTPSAYALASPRRPGAALAAEGRFTTVYDDGLRRIVRAPGDEAGELSELGFAVRRLPDRPIAWSARPTIAPRVTLRAAPPSPLVVEMLSRMPTNRLNTLMRQLTGLQAPVAGGELYTVATRNTPSGTPIQKATQFVYDRMQALGLAVSFQAWASGGSSGRNVVAVQTGETAPTEVVVIVAHLDNQPSGSVAPGADDNASGAAAVIAAAELFRQYRFQRTIRFVLVTGEEQGLYGSDAHAQAASNAGDNLVAVFNMDMIGWDSNNDGVVEIHTRVTSDPGYASDALLASAFTNAIGRYGLGGSLIPQIVADSEPGSDHASFWDWGYAAVLAIEDYEDFNSFYHMTSDTLAAMNWRYFVACVKASLATVAELARPSSRVAFDAVEVDAEPLAAATPGAGIGVGVFRARHEAGAAEGGGDGRDAAWSGMAANPNARWIRLHTAPYGTALAIDARPTNSESFFQARLSAVNSGGGTFASTNRLRFDFLTPPESNRTVLVRVHIDGRYTATSNAFDQVTDLRTLAAAGGYVTLPALAGLSNGAEFGTCDVSARLVDRAPTGVILRAVAAGGVLTGLTADVQLGTRVWDDLEASTNLLRADGWSRVAGFTNDAAPDAAHFDAGWAEAPRATGGTPPAGSPARFYRIRRTWLSP